MSAFVTTTNQQTKTKQKKENSFMVLLKEASLTTNYKRKRNIKIKNIGEKLFPFV